MKSITHCAKAPTKAVSSAKTSSDSAPVWRVALLGNPNSGKTTLINALTGSRLYVGNWPGVTVERKSGFFDSAQGKVEVIDLPGTYSLQSSTSCLSLDEQITADFIENESVDLIINVIDATNLERHLFLTSQLIEKHVPMIIVLNMMDVITAKGISINSEHLAAQLGCDVLPLTANKTKTLPALKSLILKNCQHPRYPQPVVIFSPAIEAALAELIVLLTPSQMSAFGHPAPVINREVITTPTSHCAPGKSSRGLALRILENESADVMSNDDPLQQQCAAIRSALAATVDDLELELIDTRYTYIHNLIAHVVSHAQQKRALISDWLDHIVLNRFLGIPIFLGVMYLMFLFAINIGGAFQNFFDLATDTIFVQGFGHLLHEIGCSDWLVAILAAGIGKGINTTMTFIPVISGMFFFLAFLEGSGYMARAAFVMDRFMQLLGLPGKSFVPLIVGFGCNVPAIMATRTLDSARDRILTALMAPFMSCSARLAIFAVFTATFFPLGGQNVVFALYLMGILMAILTGFLLRKTILQGSATPFIMEMPRYHWPRLATLCGETWARLKGFIVRAGKMIVPICLLIGTLNAINLHSINEHASRDISVLSWFGQQVTPVFTPMGIQDDNWPATVGLLTGTLAKEVVIATLNTLYTQVGHLAQPATENFHFWAQMGAALQTIPDNLRALPDALANPILASAPDHTVSPGVYGVMAQHFDGKIGAFAYLLFVLLYIPCASTVATLAKEIGRGWSIFSLLWSTGLAYATAVIFYQLMTFARHPLTSMLWTIGLLIGLALMLVVVWVKWRKKPVKHDKNVLPTGVALS